MPSKTTVLFVEYETDAATALDETSDDLEVYVRRSASGCMDRLERGAVDCVIGNYRLPETDGLALLDAVRDEHPNLPFVLFTGAGNERVASEAISAGVTDYVRESDIEGPDALRERVDRAIERQLTMGDEGRIRALMTAFPDVAFLLDEEGRYHELLVGPDTDTLRTTAPANLVGKRLHEVLDDRKADRFLEHVHHTLETGAVETIEYRLEVSSGTRWFEARTTPLGRKIDGNEVVVWVARDVTERRERERTLERQHEELEMLNQINRVIQEVIHELVRAATRDDIEQMVCDRLVASRLYELAWTDESEMEREGVTPQASAGDLHGYLDVLVEFGSELENDPAERAMRTGEVQIIRSVRDTDLLPEAVREEALSRGVESGISIPLTYGNTIYGTLSLVSTRSGVFSERAQAAFEILGETIGFAINAARNKKLLLSDTSVELEFLVNDPQEVFLSVSERLRCTCRLHGLVPAPDGRLLHYVHISDASSNRALDIVSDAEQVVECRVIDDEGDECVLETVMTASTVKRLVETGAAVQSAVADDGTVRIVAEVPQDADVRTVVDTFTAAYPDSKLVGKRSVDRPIQTAQEFRQSLTDHLTDRQEMAIRTAYYAGYYDWPRGSTAEEIAESLDIASATLHYHLRKAQQELLAAFLDD